VEVGEVRKRLLSTIAAARQRTQQQRQRTADAEKAFAVFLEAVATPVTRQLAAALKAEGHSFTVFTPGDGLRLASDRGRDDFIEFALDSRSNPPQVIGRISHSRGSRTMDEEKPIKAATPPEALSEEDVLDFLLHALEPWLER
jgi:hypothetical protein